MSTIRLEIVTVEEKLTGYGFDFQGAEESQFSFIYGAKDETMMVTCFYPDKIITGISVMFYSKNRFNSYIQSIKDKGYVLISNEITDNSIVKHYSNNEFRFIFEITKRDDKTNMSLYTLFFTKSF